MAILPIYLHPHPVLRQEADAIDVVDDTVTRLAHDMIETMDRIGFAVGLAAPQVGQSVQITVLDMDVVARYAGVGHELTGKCVFINPEIISCSARTADHDGEGCLSIPQLYATVKRPHAMRVRFMNLAGEWQTHDFEGYYAFALDHEIDHLKGVLFTDRLSSLKSKMALNKYRRLKKTFAKSLSYAHVDETDTVYTGHVHGDSSGG